MAKRRYLPIAEYPVYNHFYDWFLQKSQLLNSGSNQIANSSTIFYDKNGLKNALYQLIGDDKGRYLSYGEYMLASIPSCENTLNELEKQFKIYCQQQVNGGYERPTKWPLELEEQKFKFEAKMDILLIEKVEIEKRLKEIDDKIKIEDASKVLQYGLKQEGQLLNGVLIFLDFQRIIEKNKILVIGDGPYKGLSVPDYRKLANQWRIDIEAEHKEKYKQLVEKARLEGLPRPHFVGLSSRKYRLEDLPKFPSSTINHFETKVSDASDSSGSYQRKRKTLTPYEDNK